MHSMYNVHILQQEIICLKKDIANWHLQAWKHRLNGEKEHMKAVHRKIKTTKQRITDCVWMIRQIYESTFHTIEPYDWAFVFKFAIVFYMLLRGMELFFDAMVAMRDARITCTWSFVDSIAHAWNAK